jgi:subtilisin family serine protease
MKPKLLVSSVFVVLLLLPLVFASAQTPAQREYAPVQKGYVASGEKVQTFATDRILVKFTEASLENSKLNIGLQRGSAASGAQTGIASVDALGRQIGVVKVSRPFIELKNKEESTRLGVDRWYMIEVRQGTDIMNVVDRYAADPNVEHASPDWVAFPAAVPNDPLHPDHWGHNNTAQLLELDWGGTYEHIGPGTVGTPGFDSNAHGAWDVTYGSSSIVIAILDSGVDAGHPDLNQVAGYDYGDNDSNPDWYRGGLQDHAAQGGEQRGIDVLFVDY